MEKNRGVGELAGKKYFFSDILFVLQKLILDTFKFYLPSVFL